MPVKVDFYVDVLTEFITCGRGKTCMLFAQTINATRCTTKQHCFEIYHLTLNAVKK